jgi:hypothetical protein
MLLVASGKFSSLCLLAIRNHMVADIGRKIHLALLLYIVPRFLEAVSFKPHRGSKQRLH